MTTRRKPAIVAESTVVIPDVVNGDGLADIEAYEAHPTDMQPHIRRLMNLVIEHDVKVAVELGVRYGYSSAGILHGLRRTGGHLWSVENEAPQPFMDAAWTFISGDDRTAAVQSLVPTAIDLLFIDTTHELPHTAFELDAYGRRVRAGGVIVCHDTNVDGVLWPLRDVWRRRGTKWIEWRESYGLAAIVVE